MCIYSCCCKKETTKVMKGYFSAKFFEHCQKVLQKEDYEKLVKWHERAALSSKRDLAKRIVKYKCIEK